MLSFIYFLTKNSTTSVFMYLLNVKLHYLISVIFPLFEVVLIGNYGYDNVAILFLIKTIRKTHVRLLLW
jgi:nitrate reductase NapE component